MRALLRVLAVLLGLAGYGLVAGLALRAGATDMQAAAICVLLGVLWGLEGLIMQRLRR